VAVDNATATTGDAGTRAAEGGTLGTYKDSATRTAFLDGRIVFAAHYDGDVRDDPNWQRFLDWARNHYGLPVAIG
jgi:hypothetical protein